MCGIAGFWSIREGDVNDLSSIAARMVDAISHRGPDDSDQWVDSRGAVALGHCRLSIVDLSAAGHQPMHSASGRFVLAFNGEIYNHQELRRTIEAAGAAPAWRGHSDTETLLAAIERWGLETSLRMSVGMFALALWDIHERRLYLARDRFGEKPLYYGWADGAFLFGSELKGLRAHPGFRPSVCREALAEYLRFMCVPAPRSIYNGVYKLEPGSLLTITGKPPAHPPTRPLSVPASHETMTASRWWSLATAMEQAAAQPLIEEEEALTVLESRLGEAVQLQSLADVPLGAFLSGGVDSSLIAATMQRRSTRRIQTFTVGFEEAEFDESAHARAVAKHLGTEHHELRVSAETARGVIPLLPSMYDEPFGDSSQIPTHLVCRAARQKVTVALSGDAGDELFGGYNRYLWGPRIWGQLSWLPYAARQALGSGLRLAASASERSSLHLRRVQRPAEKMRKLAVAIHGARSVDDLYRNLVTCWSSPESLLRGSAAAGGAATIPGVRLPNLPSHGASDARSRMMYWDASTYLPDDILCKVDRAAMAIGLETRVPFLDHRVADLAWRLPTTMKIRGSETKWILRQLLYRYVPRKLIERPKSGFAIPLAEWLRGPLRAWAEDLLHPHKLKREGYLDPGPIQAAWRQHLSGEHDWSSRLWCVLMFEAWLETAGISVSPRARL